jgi:hypothetical protein
VCILRASRAALKKLSAYVDELPPQRDVPTCVPRPHARKSNDAAHKCQAMPQAHWKLKASRAVRAVIDSIDDHTRDAHCVGRLTWELNQHCKRSFRKRRNTSS